MEIRIQKEHFLKSVIVPQMLRNRQWNSIKFDVFYLKGFGYHVYAYRYITHDLHPEDPRYNFMSDEMMEEECKEYSNIIGYSKYDCHIMNRIQIVCNNSINLKIRSISDMIKKKSYRIHKKLH